MMCRWLFESWRIQIIVTHPPPKYLQICFLCKIPLCTRSPIMVRTHLSCLQLSCCCFPSPSCYPLPVNVMLVIHFPGQKLKGSRMGGGLQWKRDESQGCKQGSGVLSAVKQWPRRTWGTIVSRVCCYVQFWVSAVTVGLYGYRGTNI